MTEARVPLNLTVVWADGTASSEPPIQVHALDEHTFILRQSLTTHYEAPFVFLLLGDTGALLIDTGATADAVTWPLRETVDGIIDGWLRQHPRPHYSLTVAHSHGHDDHIAGDAQFEGRADTRVVAPTLDAVREFFGFTTWPDDQVTFDLGGRMLRLIAGPGHEDSAMVFYDPRTGVLFTGDTVYPGRLYVVDMPAYIATLERLVAVIGEVQVSYVIGCHIEMSTTPGRDFALGSRRHPGEPPLWMTPAQLLRLHQRTVAIADAPGVHPFDDLIIYNGADVVEGFLRHNGATH